MRRTQRGNVVVYYIGRGHYASSVTRSLTVWQMVRSSTRGAVWVDNEEALFASAAVAPR